MWVFSVESLLIQRTYKAFDSIHCIHNKIRYLRINRLHVLSYRHIQLYNIFIFCVIVEIKLSFTNI